MKRNLKVVSKFGRKTYELLQITLSYKISFLFEMNIKII